MSLARWPVCTIAVLAALGLAGCGNLDDTKLEGEIKTGIEKQAGVKIRSVSCPDDRPIKRGDVFTCTATATSGETGQVRVTQIDDEGNVRWQLVGTG